MDYVDGPNLSRLVQDRPLPAKRAAAYLKPVAEAVHFAHERGILHRDLKPSNVLVGSDDRPRVADFGLAKRFSSDSSLTISGQVLGSPNFMPPEQAGATHVKVGRHSDVYSMGAILYHLLTGRPPFQADSVPATLQMVTGTEPLSPRLLNASVPRDLETICLKCLEKEPSRRYATAQELADELGRFLADEPIHARPVGRTEKVWRWCRRKPALAASFFLIIILLLIVSIGSPIAAFRINQARKAQELEQYYASIGLADGAIRDGHTDRALDLLTSCPAKYRNWEWGWLISQCHQDFLTIPAHTNSPNKPSFEFGSENHLHGLAFSPDGSRLFTHGVDGFVKVWSADDGRLIFDFGGGTNWVTTHNWDRDARRLAVGCTNGLAHVFDTQTWWEIRTVPHGNKPIRWVSLNSDGHKLSTAGDNSVVQVWDVDSGKDPVRLSLPDEPLENVHFDGGGERLVTKQASKVVVWDASSGAELSRVQPKDRSADALIRESSMKPVERADEGIRAPATRRSTAIVASSENRDGTLLVTFDADGQAKLWRAGGSSVEMGILRGAQSGELRWATFSEDNKLLCTGGELSTARVWETATGTELFAIPTRTYAAEFSKDGSKVITVGTENVARIWEVKTGREYLTLRGHGVLVGHATFSPDGMLAATAGFNGLVKLWSASTGREVLRGDLWTHGACYSRDGKRVAAGSSGLDLRVWDAESGAELVRFRPDMEGALAAQFSPDGRWIATAGADGTARLWDSRTDREVRAFEGHTQYIWGLSFSPDGRRLATGSMDKTARIWDVETGQLLHKLEGHSKGVWAVEFSPDGLKVVTSADDFVSRVWEVESGRLLFTLGNEARPSGLVRFTRDGRRIFSGSMEKNIRIWDATTGVMLDTWALRNPVGWLFDFSPDGSRLVASFLEGSGFGSDVALTEVWDVKHGRALLSLRGHTEGVGGSFFRGDGERILTESVDGTTRQWESFPWIESKYPGTPTQSLRERIATYARSYWSERLRLETEVARKPAPTPVQPLKHWERSRWPKRDERSGPNQIDLTESFTGLLGVCLHPSPDNLFSNHLRELRAGTVTLSNVVFDIRGVVQLRRLEPKGGMFSLNWERQPVRAGGIKVGNEFRRLHVLHAISQHAWVPKARDGTQVGSYVLHYRDGTQAELPIIYGRHVRDWWTRGAEPDEALKPLENGTVVWTGTNLDAQKNGSTLRLYLSSFDNPRPGVEVVSIDYVSAMTQAAPFLVAMTVEE